jgi:hypothetical protein
MLRRVSLALRVGLAVVGAILMILAVASYWYWASAGIASWSLHISASSGQIDLQLLEPGIHTIMPTTHLDWGRQQPSDSPGRVYFFETHSFVDPIGGSARRLSIGIWLLAFLCLAWPVTSFVIARRRRGTRGFEVEAKDIDAVSTVDS